ncbi:hypothetical protein LINPERPRIM_LOCUS18141, partial [Linum perenne]
FGSFVASWFEVLHPGRVLGLVTLGIPFSVPIKGASLANQPLPEGFYISRWREPGRAEADFGRLDAKTVVRNVYILFSGSELPTAAENQEIMDLVENQEFPTMEDYAKNTVKQFVPDLKTVFMAEGTHFIQEQLPEEVNQLILDFLRARIWP